VDARSILAIPSVYRLFIRLIAGNYRSAYVRDYVRPTPGDRVLDLGCGTADVVDYLGPVRYHGIDISPQYIDAARRRFGDRAEFTCQPVQDVVVREPGRYDRVLATGLLHHLDDTAALELFRLARLALRPGGTFVTFDGCFVPGQSRLARGLLRLDRGRFVREADGYVGLAEQVFPRVRAAVRHDLLRVPYSHIILECTAS
jgi:SAM-dependent methyltransferase